MKERKKNERKAMNGNGRKETGRDIRAKGLRKWKNEGGKEKKKER